MGRARFSVVGCAGAVVLCVAVAAPVRAQNPQQMQMMADLHQLTEMTAKLQQSVNVLAETVKSVQDQIKAVNGRLDSQGTQISTMAATERTLIDSLSTTLGTLEQKVRDNNMNTQRLTEEMGAIRKGLGMLTDLITNLSQGQATSGGVGANPSASGQPGGAPIADSPGQMFQDAYGFYSRAEYALARSAFVEFLEKFPTSPDAPAAQYNIGMSYYNEAGSTTAAADKAAKYGDAVTAFTAVVTKYKECGCDAEPDAYYERGMAYHALKQDVKAKEDWTKILTEYARTKSPVWETDNSLATQALKGIK